MLRVRNTFCTMPGPLYMWNTGPSPVTMPAASWPRCCSSSSASYSSWLTGVCATTPTMPHMGTLDLLEGGGAGSLRDRRASRPTPAAATAAATAPPIRSAGAKSEFCHQSRCGSVVQPATSTNASTQHGAAHDAEHRAEPAIDESESGAVDHRPQRPGDQRTHHDRQHEDERECDRLGQPGDAREIGEGSEASAGAKASPATKPATHATQPDERADDPARERGQRGDAPARRGWRRRARCVVGGTGSGATGPRRLYFAAAMMPFWPSPFSLARAASAASRARVRRRRGPARAFRATSCRARCRRDSPTS